MKKYIIMADGHGVRWNNHLGHPKHLILVQGETLLERTVRLIHQFSPHSEIVITSHDSRYEVEGAVRYEPENNVLEIDRFTYELIENDVCFLYGDTYYSEQVIQKIVAGTAQELLFFGNEDVIVAVKVLQASVMRQHIDRVTALFRSGKIQKCKGWELYHSFAGLPLEGKTIGAHFILLPEEATYDFNYPEDLEKLSQYQK